MFKLFLQDSPNDCSTACLAGILHHYGLKTTPIDLALQIEFTRAGTSNIELQALARRYGLESKLIRLPAARFGRLEGPCIAYVPSDMEGLVHNLVIYRVKGERLWIADPARGKYTIRQEAFAREYEGLLLIFRPTADFRKGSITPSYLIRFMRFVSAYRNKMLLSLAVGLAASGLGFGLIYLSKYFVDQVLPALDIDLVLVFALVYFLARLLNVAATGFNHLFTVVVRNSVNRMLSERFFDHALDLEKKQLDNRAEGDFLHLFSQIEVLTAAIANYFASFVLVVFGILVKAGFLIFLYDPGLAGLILGIVFLNGMLGFLFSRATSEHANRKTLAFSQITTALLNSLADIRVVRVFAAHSWLERDFRRLLADGLESMRRIALFEVYGRSLADLLGMIAEGAIFLVCGLRIMDGSYTVGDFLVFLTFARGLTAESLQFPGLVLSFETQLRSFARVQAILALPAERGGTREVEGSGLEVEFKNVNFSYVKGVPVLENVSFTIERNRTTALVGESGSGKTTLMNLLMGFYQPRSGTILVNGKDLCELDLESYRGRLAAVFQDTTLFHGSLFANLSLGNPAAHREKVIEIGAALGLDTMVDRLPFGFRQPLYPGSLSGGQIQRVGIWRAMCKPFDLLIMDEATSHLDSLTEERVVRGIDGLCAAGKTRAVIAHRLSTVKQADRIIVMRRGRVAETGTHQELVARRGVYLDLIQRQYEVNLVPQGSA